MADLVSPARRSPLAHRAPLASVGSVQIAERPFLGKFILRAAADPAAERLAAALGLRLPLDPLSSSTDDDISVLWMGPDEWMLVTAAGEASARATELQQAFAGIHHQLVDVSDYYTTLEVVGSRARELLMKITTLDLHPRAFGAGMVTGCILGRANATLWQPIGTDEVGGPAFRLFVRWSMADYLWCLLANAGREWGVPEQVPVKGETLVVA